MDLGYALVSFVAWLLAGSCKFIINSIEVKTLDFARIGYGGLPSNHTAIVSSVAVLVAIREGVNTPVFGLAIALVFIVIIDATSLRRQIGVHARIINRLYKGSQKPLRERMGHTFLEIAAGIIVGCFSAWLINKLFL